MVIQKQRRNAVPEQRLGAAAEVGDDQRLGIEVTGPVEQIRAPGRLALAPALGGDMGEAGCPQRAREDGACRQAIRVTVAHDVDAGQRAVLPASDPRHKAGANLFLERHRCVMQSSGRTGSAPGLRSPQASRCSSLYETKHHFGPGARGIRSI